MQDKIPGGQQNVNFLNEKTADKHWKFAGVREYKNVRGQWAEGSVKDKSLSKSRENWVQFT